MEGQDIHPWHCHCWTL